MPATPQGKDAEEQLHFSCLPKQLLRELRDTGSKPAREMQLEESEFDALESSRESGSGDTPEAENREPARDFKLAHFLPIHPLFFQRPRDVSVPRRENLS